jgi:hypothetical protein
MIEGKNDFHFRGQMPDEVVKDYYRRHWIVLLPHIFTFVLFITIIITLLINLRGVNLPPFTAPLFELFVLLSILGTGILIHWFFMNFLEYFMNTVIITNNRLVVVRKTLFTHDDIESVYMREIQDIQKQQIGIFKNLLDFGELLINVGVPDLTILKMVPNPDYHFRLLNMIRHERYIEKDKEEAREKVREVKKIENEKGMHEEKDDKPQNNEQEIINEAKIDDDSIEHGEKKNTGVDPLAEKRKNE